MSDGASHSNRRWVIAGVAAAVVALVAALAVAFGGGSKSKSSSATAGGASGASAATTTAGAPPTANPGAAATKPAGDSKSGSVDAGTPTTAAGSGFSATATVPGPSGSTKVPSGISNGAHAPTAPTVNPVSGSKALICPSSSPACAAHPGDDLRVEIESQPWKSITSACFTFTFGGDLLDHADDIELSNAGGFVNNGTTVSSRKFCITPASAPQAIRGLLDGRELLDVWTTHGTVDIASIIIAINGKAA
jgi:hypothetical protein